MGGCSVCSWVDILLDCLVRPDFFTLDDREVRTSVGAFVVWDHVPVVSR